jgi:hypothetical protein
MRPLSFSIAVVVLLRFHVETHILGRHQPDLVTMVAKQTTKMMCAAAGLHRHHAARRPRGKLDHAVSAQPPTQNDMTGDVQSHDAAAVLAQVYPQHRDLYQPAPYSSGYPASSASLARQRRGAGHFIKRARSKNAQNCFLYCLLPIAVASVIGFQSDEVEKDFLRAN